MIVNRAPWLVLLGWVLAAAPALGGEPPAWLPKYDLDIRIDTGTRLGHVTERVTWTNNSKHLVHEIVFNAHAHYTIPGDDIGSLAKMLEILRMSPSEAMSFDGPALDVESALLCEDPTGRGSAENGEVGGNTQTRRVRSLHFYYQADNPTALVVSLPRPVAPGDSVTIELALTLKIPPKKGRWGQWQG